MNTKEERVEFETILRMLAEGLFDWAFFSFYEGNLLPHTRVRISLYKGDINYTHDSGEADGKTFWEVWPFVVGDAPYDRRVIKAGGNIPGEFRARAFAPTYPIPRHIHVRGVEYPWD